MTTATVSVAVRDRGQRYVARLPAVWEAGAAREARKLLGRAQQTMRALRSVREVEEVTSGPGSYARTKYRLRAPDRLAFRTNSQVESVVVGKRQWLRTADSGWRAGPYGSGIPFSVRRWFRWTTYAQAVRLLDRRREGGRPIVELALMDPATPVWLRLWVDERSGRVLRERLITPAHFMKRSYLAYDRPLDIRAPDVR